MTRTWLDRIGRKPATATALGGDVRDVFLAEVVKDHGWKKRVAQTAFSAGWTSAQSARSRRSLGS